MSGVLRPDRDAVAAFWDALVAPGNVHEVRVLDTRGRFAREKILIGYFDDRERFVTELSGITSADAAGCYLSLNPVKADFLAKANNRLIRGFGGAAGDDDVIRLRHLLIDVDSDKGGMSGICATKAELNCALDRRTELERFLLSAMNFPPPVAYGSSGNGGTLIYGIDLPNDAEHRGIIRRALAALAAIFDGDGAHVDTSVANPSRTTRIAGTVNAKGDSIPERPHRHATATYPGGWPVPLAALQALAANAPEERQSSAGRFGGADLGEDFTGKVEHVRNALATIAPGAREKAWSNGGVCFELPECLLCDGEGKAVVFVQTSGAHGYMCQRASCSANERGGLYRLPLHVQDALRPPMQRAATATVTFGGNQSPPPRHADSQRRTVDAPPPEAALRIISLGDVEPKAIEWLWPDWLARGKVTVIGGHPGDGKSTLTVALAGMFTEPGRTMPDGVPAPSANVLFLLAEDALDDTLRPRIDQLGGDPHRMEAIQAVVESEQDRIFSLTRHLPLLEAAIAKRGYGLVVIDPLTSFMQGGDRNDEGSVRDALTPLSKLAERTGAAVLAVMHVGKSGGGTGRRPLQQLLGSTAFGAIAREAWMVERDPEDEAGDRRILGVVKSNIGYIPKPLVWSREKDGPIIWHGTSAYSMDDLLSGGGPEPRRQADAFLTELLAGGSKPSSEVFAAGKASGLTEKQLRSAKDRLGVRAMQIPAGPGGRWFWFAPSEVIFSTPDDNARASGETRAVTSETAA